MACAWPDPVSCSNALSYDRVNQPEIRRKLTDCPLQVDPVPCDKSQILLLQKVYSGSPSLWLRLQHSSYRNSMRLALSSAFGPFAVDDSYVHKNAELNCPETEVTRNQGIFSSRFNHHGFGLGPMAENVDVLAPLFKGVVRRSE